jgi:hypothetical protein
MVRAVERTTGGIITLNLDPSPHGEWVPWPAPTMNGIAQARRIPKPVPGEDRWDEHACR